MLARPKGRPPVYTEADRQRMRDLYQETGSIRAVARRIGCSALMVRSVVYPGAREKQREAARRYARAHYVPTVDHRADGEVVDYSPLFDPRRDGSPVYADAQAQIFGDPPVGRREMIANHVPTYVEPDDDF